MIHCSNLTKDYKSFLLTTHDMTDIEKACARAIMINKGRKLFDGTLEALRQNSRSDSCVTGPARKGGVADARGRGRALPRKGGCAVKAMRSFFQTAYTAFASGFAYRANTALGVSDLLVRQHRQPALACGAVSGGRPLPAQHLPVLYSGDLHVSAAVRLHQLLSEPASV